MKSLLLKFDSYTGAKSWDDLVHAFMESLKDSPFDELILLGRANTFGLPRQPPKDVRLVIYDRFDDLPKLLSVAPSPFNTIATPTHQTQPEVEAITGIQPDSDYGEQEQRKVAEIDEKRVDAAKKIQATYRRHLKRKDVVLKGIDATQARHWDLLRKRSTEMEWPKNSRYYVLFRVPLGSILACLDTLGGFFSNGKGRAKKQRTKADHQDYEALTKVLDQHR